MVRKKIAVTSPENGFSAVPVPKAGPYRWLWVSVSGSLLQPSPCSVISRFRPSLEEALQWRDSLDKLLQNNCKSELLLTKVSGGAEVRAPWTARVPAPS